LELIPSERVGFYGKNAIIQHPDYRSWISLSGFVTDAELEPDDPLDQDCSKCELCPTVCPTAARLPNAGIFILGMTEGTFSWRTGKRAVTSWERDVQYAGISAPRIES